MALDLSQFGAVPAQTPPPTAPPPSSGPDLSQFGGVSASANTPPQQQDPSLLSQASDLVGQLPGVQMAKGIVKGGMQSAGGLIHLFSDYNPAGSMYDAASYKRTNPHATDDQAWQAVQQGYRAPESQKANDDLKAAGDWLVNHAQTHGFFQGLGSVGESVAEFLGPEALGVLGKGAEGAEVAGKAATYAERLKSGQKIAQVLNDHPVLARVVAAGVRAMKGAAEGGGQTFVKTGGDTQQAAEGAAAAGIGGAAIESGAAAAKGLINHLAPTVENLGGVEVTRLPSQQPYASTAQQIAATAEHIPDVQRAQQAAGNEVIGNAAKSAAEQHLTELNEGRTPEPRAEGPQRRPYQFRIGGTPTYEEVSNEPLPRRAPTPKRGGQVGGTTVFEGKGPSETQVWNDPVTGEQQSTTIHRGDTTAPGSHRARAYRITDQLEPGTGPVDTHAEGGGTLVTEDPTIVKAHIDTLNNAIDNASSDAERQQLIAQRAEMQRQMSEYHASRAGDAGIYTEHPTFEPVDIRKTVARVGSYADAADELENAAKPVYNRLDDLTGGKFTRLREENKRAWTAVQNGGGEAAEARLTRTQQDMDAMLSGHDGDVGDSVSQTDLTYANEAWKKAQMLRDVHRHIESAFDASIGASQRANAYRGFNGNRLRQSLKDLTDKYGEKTLNRYIGMDQFVNLSKLADITRTTADRAKFGGGVNEVARFVVRNEGKVAAGVAGAGATIGHFVGGPQAAAIGGVAGEAMYLATRRVMRAIATNPQVGRNFTFALEAGARPEVYAPMIAKLITQGESK